MFHRFGVRIARTVQFLINSFKYSRQVTGNLRIPETHDTIAFMLKPALPFAITFAGLVLIVVTAVKFNDETCSRTEKVDDVGTDRSLSSKMSAIHWQFLQGAPQCALMWCRVGTQSFGCCTADQFRDHCGFTPPRLRQAQATLPLQGRVIGAHSEKPSKR
jgi:hypothetical protein